MPRTPTIAVDLAKSVFEVAISARAGRVAQRHRFTRAQFARFVATTPPATVLMEACGTRALLGPPGAGAWPPRRAPRPARRARPAQQDRSQRCQGAPRSRAQRGTAPGAGENRSAAGPHRAAPPAPPARDFHHGPERIALHVRGRRTTAVESPPSPPRMTPAPSRSRPRENVSFSRELGLVRRSPDTV